MPKYEGASSNPLPSDDRFWQVASPRDARSRLVEALRFELLGPADPNETLAESPITRYTTGQLAPFGTQTPDDDHDEGGQGHGRTEESGAADATVPMSQTITIASIGLSFLVPRDIKQLTVTATWGTYAPVKTNTESTDDQSPDPSAASGASGSSTSTRARTTWVRTPCEPEPVTIQLRPGECLQHGERGERLVANDDIFIEHISKTVGEDQAVSIFLVNRRIATKRGRRRQPPATEWIFQPRITVHSPSNEAVFAPRYERPRTLGEEPDLESNRLLFRNRIDFASGHNCATTSIQSDGEKLAHAVQTELIPSYELPKVAPPAASAVQLDMAALGKIESPEALQRSLSPLLDEYENWIAQKQVERESLPDHLQSVAKQHLEQCTVANARMRVGLKSLTTDNDAFEAFRFANRAMSLQRTHTVWAHDRQSDSERAGESPTPQGQWRPFQLGFILLNLAGLIDPGHPDRDKCDLLWFPTGGGKTEAYLGLTAFTIALRRRRSILGVRTDAGLSVLMRYTLRLLTLQQFQRASTLICACELLRTKDPEVWGTRRFSLGLWIGYQGTPNSHNQARQALNKLQEHAGHSSHENLPEYLSGANPCVLESCPWCGEPLTPNDYRSDAAALRTRVWCPRPRCPFHKAQRAEGLPVLVIDEEIYLECPSMLIATVDKFAQMPWNGNVRALFGRVTKECGQCGFLTPDTAHPTSHRSGHVEDTMPLAPPDLIIQDELHLISGPLGTLVGLYENAVDFLCHRHDNGVIRPKLIASTATARRAHDQVRTVFQRDLDIFPPAGLEPDDSFFAVEQPASDTSPGRLYVGVCAPGKSLKTGYIRLAASLLSSAGGLANHNPKLAEPYLTLVSYYNSIKDLGGHVRLMEDDIPARLKQLRSAGLPDRRRELRYEELTSRRKQEQIPRLLRQMEQRHDTHQKGTPPWPLDAVLASNMISVGVDIDRFGLMTVNGQPKATAEYIQATSRVGRQPSGPGLVVTLYNWSRARDLSHYERFEHYHATLYRSVEAVSATPFSSRAQDRGLRAVYVAMARLGMDSWTPEQAANQFDPDNGLVEEIINCLHTRARACVSEADADALERDLKGFTDSWAMWAESPLRYGWRHPDAKQVPRETVLLKIKEGGALGKWPAPQSLREVEEQSFVRILKLNAD